MLLRDAKAEPISNRMIRKECVSQASLQFEKHLRNRLKGGNLSFDSQCGNSQPTALGLDAESMVKQNGHSGMSQWVKPLTPQKIEKYRERSPGPGTTFQGMLLVTHLLQLSQVCPFFFFLPK